MSEALLGAGPPAKQYYGLQIVGLPFGILQIMLKGFDVARTDCFGPGRIRIALAISEPYWKKVFQPGRVSGLELFHGLFSVRSGKLLAGFVFGAHGIRFRIHARFH